MKSLIPGYWAGTETRESFRKEDYELSKQDFDIIEVVFRIYLENRPAHRDLTYEMKVRDLYEKFRLAHTAKIIYE